MHSHPEIGIGIVGEGEISRRHLAAFSRIEGATVSALAGRDPERTSALAREFGTAVATDAAQLAARDDVDAVVIATPTALHVEQAGVVLRAGKHCLIEIPLAEDFVASASLRALEGDRVVMVAHSRRFGPNHRWLRQRFETGRSRLQHLEVRADFLRRSNANAAGEPRDWTDNLLWHHATHSVDLFRAQTSEEITAVTAMAGPAGAPLGIVMDLAAGLRTASGVLCSLSLSFNSDSPLQTTYRYLCDDGTYVATGDSLQTGWGAEIDLSGVLAADGVPADTSIEAQDREFVAAIRDGRPAAVSLDEALLTMAVIARLQTAIDTVAPDAGGQLA